MRRFNHAVMHGWVGGLKYTKGILFPLKEGFNQVPCSDFAGVDLCTDTKGQYF